MEQIQGQTLSTQPALDGQAPAAPATPADISSLQQFVVEPQKPAEPQVQGQAPAQPDPNASELLRLANQRYAENMALREQITRLQQQQPQPAPAQGANPHDPNTDWPNWIRFENKAAAQEAAMQTLQMVVQQAQQFSRQNQEAQWQQAHPNVDINSVKAFAEFKGVRELDDAYALMTMGQQIQGAVQQAQQTVFNQFRQPANPAQPLRGGMGSGAPVSLSFEKMLEAYTQNPNIENGWNPQLREMFHRELDVRASMGA